MNNKLERLIQQLPPYIALGVAIALVVGLLIMFSYVLVWGFLLGCIIWLGVIIKNYLFPSTSLTKTNNGRIIEHNDKEDE